jgi:hypothetical protein
LARILREWPVLDEHFDAFYEWIDRVRSSLHLPMIGVCFEVASCQTIFARVHAHAFLSMDAGDALWSGNDALPPARRFVAECLSYQQSRVHLRPLVFGRKRQVQRIMSAISTGMYYVLARKEGQLRSRGNRSIEDSCV